MAGSDGNNPLLLPEVIREVCGHLNATQDLLNAILVSSAWAEIATEQLWSSPPPSALCKLPQPLAQERALLARRLHFEKSDKGLSSSVADKLQRLNLPNLQRITYDHPTILPKPLAWMKPLLGAKLRHLTYSDLLHPEDIFATLKAHCYNLRSLCIETGTVGGVSEHIRGLQEDLKHLYPLLRQCPNLGKLTLFMDSGGQFGGDLAVDVGQVIAIPHLRDVCMGGALASSESLSAILSKPIAVVRHLNLSYVQPEDVVALLRCLRFIGILELEPHSTHMHFILPAIAGCTSLTTLKIYLYDVTVPLYRDDLLALRALSQLESLSLIGRTLEDGLPSYGNWDIIDSITGCTKLAVLHLWVYDVCFTTDQFIVLGAALPQLKVLEGQIVLDMSLLKTPPADDLVQRNPGLCSDRKPSAMPLFPMLEHLIVIIVKIPPCGAMEEAFERPGHTEKDSFELGFYLARLYARMVPHLLRQMPLPRKMSVDGDYIPAEERTELGLDTEWYLQWSQHFVSMVTEAILQRAQSSL